MHMLRTLAFAAAIAVAAPAMAQTETRATLLSVNAQGVVEAPPDMATITVGVVATGRTALAAQAENNRRMQALTDALRAEGLADRDIQTAYLSVSPQYARRDSQRAIAGYQASNSVRLRVRNLDNTGRILDAVVAAGGNTLNGLAFSFQDPDAQRDGARRNAVAEARRRADLYAEALGVRVHRVVSISEPGAGISEQLVLTATLTTDSLLNDLPQVMPAAPIAPGEIETHANVSVMFELR